MKRRRSLPCLFLSLSALASAGRAAAQRIEALGPAVRTYVSVGTPKVILEHVEVIDGAGTAPAPDRNVTIEGGKITAISVGAAVAPSDGTTILDLEGYSVMRLGQPVRGLACPGHPESPVPPCATLREWGP
jgi:hypothetical protein